MKRNQIGMALVLALGLSAGMARAEGELASPNYQLTKRIAVGGPAQWDYITVDADAHRLYLAQGVRIAVVDTAEGKLLGEVTGLSGAHGVALVPEMKKGFATSGKDKSVVVFDLETFKVLKTIPTGADKPDAIVYDPASKRVFVCNGKVGPVTVIDPAALDAATTSIDVAGKLEFAAADGAGHVYVNVEDKSELVAINSKTMKVDGHWPLAPGEEPTGLAMDATARRLFVGCGNKKMVVVDADSGKIVATPTIGEGVDGVACDGKLGLALSANGKDATATVVNAKGEVVQTVTTVKGARTIALDEKTHAVYLPAMIEQDGKKTFGVVVLEPKIANAK